LSGNGLGGFIAATNFSVGTGPRSIAVGDFNGDGKFDLAVPNTGSNTVSVRLGNGSGGFTGTNDEFVGDGPRTIAIGDFNADGRTDIATAFTASTKLSVLLADYAISVSGNNMVINPGDTMPDVGNHTDFGMVYVGSQSDRTYTIENTTHVPFVVSGIVFKGGDSSMFSLKSLNPSAIIPAGGTARFTIGFLPVSQGKKSTILHINSENCPSNYFSYSIQGTALPLPEPGSYPDITISSGQNATFAPNVPPAFATSIIAYTNPSFSGIISVNPSNGIVSITNAMKAGSYKVVVQSFNQGGSDSTSFNLTVINPGCSRGAFQEVSSFNGGIKPVSVNVGDFNSDGIQDIVVANNFNNNTNSVSVWMGNGLGGFVDKADFSAGVNPGFITVTDLNGDGHQDLVVANETSNNVSLLFGNGSGGFSNAVHFPVGQYPSSITVGDFNHDGHKDLAISIFGQNSISILLGNGSGWFLWNNIMHETGSRPKSISSGDFNGDGFTDLLTANSGSNSVSVLLGNGLGDFTKTIEVPVGSQPFYLAVGDFNGDGKKDFATANYASHQVSIRLGDGKGGFSGNTEVPVGNSPNAVAIGDFNGDGHQDFATVNFLENSSSIRLGNGLGGFTGASDVPIGKNPYSISIGDFNADGIFDIASTSIGDITKSVSILLGEASGNSQNTWLGITEDWSSPGNWSTGLVPGICSWVIINAGVPNMPKVTGTNNKCFNITIGIGAILHLAKDAKLEIIGK
jgi:hypothetical protein